MKTSGKHSKEEAHSHEHIKHEAKKEEEKPIDKISKAEDKKLPGSGYLVISTIIIIILVALIIFLLVRKPAGTGANTGNGAGTSTTPDKDKVKVEFYVMSQCPYGTQVENAIAPTLENLGDAVNFQLDYIVQEESPGKFNSLHDYCVVGGQRVSKQEIPTVAECENKGGTWNAIESKGDIVQLCAKKYYPDNYQYVKFIICQNKDASNVDTNWQACAQETSMDSTKLKACLEGEEGKSLLRASMQRAQARQASGSPTMFIGDATYSGQRDSLSFQTAICKFSKSSACVGLPKCASDADCTEQPTKDGFCINPGKENAACEYREPVKVDLLVLNDKRCADCLASASEIATQLKSLFPGLVVKEVDYSSTEGKELYKKINATYLPLMLFDEGVSKGKGYAQISGYLDQVGAYQSLRISANFDPIAEICDNNMDDNNNSKIDCADEDCKSQWKCMEKKDKPEVELFVMSQCPYGTQIEKGIIPVIETLGNKVSFAVKFCDYVMHGEIEIKEELQQYCIETEQNSKYLDYLKCFLKEGKSDECVTSTGIDKAKLSACVAAADEKYKVTKNFADKTTWKGSYPTFNIFKDAVDKYGVGGSPTLVINGVVASSARDSASLLDAVCTGFKIKPAECSSNLSSTAPTAGFGFGTTTATATAAGGCGV